MKKAVKLSLLAAMIKLACSASAVAQEAVELQTITVSGQVETEKVIKPTVERQTMESIQQELIQNNQDLIRYSPDVGIVDQGRHQKGFAIRGVEDNRVGIIIDGVKIPDSEENSLYKRYGNLNTSRQSIDPEIAATIDVVKGSDSFHQGSGSLGGGVVYRTLEAADIVSPENQFGLLYRTGYTTRNNEWLNTIGLGYMGDHLEALLLYANRHGHEKESAGGITLPADGTPSPYFGYSRQTPNPSTHDNHNYLAKLTYHINEQHHVGLSYSGQNHNNHIVEESASSESYVKSADDKAKRDTFGIFYEYLPESDYIAKVKINADWQKTKTSADNFEHYRQDLYGKPAGTPYDLNIREFNTKNKNVHLQIDSQPLNVFNHSHELSLKMGYLNQDFDVLHTDHYGWNLANNTWSSVRSQTMMTPISSKALYASLFDRIQIDPSLTGKLGLRYDWAKYHQEPLNGLFCVTCNYRDDVKFKQFSWTAGIEKQLNDNWKISYDIGTGFRFPSASEMYFEFEHPAGNWKANPNLKPERSLTHNLGLTGDGQAGKLALNLHYTRYKDFLYEQETWGMYAGRASIFQQMQNLNNAKIYGIEASGKLKLDAVMPVSHAWSLFGSLGYNKGSLSGDVDLITIQPLKAVIGLDYEDPDDKWGVYSRLSYLGGKKAKDAKYWNADYESDYDYYTGKITYTDASSVKTWPFLNDKAWVFDIFGYYKPSKNFVIRAGVYNLFDTKYHTWDSMRGLDVTGGEFNSVGYPYSRNTHARANFPGLQRYYEPGRNYAIKFEYRF